jgi:hypothetical protein
MRRAICLGAMALWLPLQAAASCGSAFCSVNTSWDAHGAWFEPGARFDLRYEYIRQDQPRTGTRDLAVGEIRHHHDEVLTVNRNLIGALDYTFSPDWAVNVLLPMVDREHQHIHNHHGARLEESWSFTELGDARVLFRRRLGAWENHEAHTVATGGLNFGVKLPTGPTDVTNAAGDLAERTLQPGSGTTDLLLGGYYSMDLPEKDWSWFMQGLAQLPLNTHDDYKPGNRITLDAGVRRALGDRLALMLQANYLFKAHDQGLQAEPEDSGGKFLFLSPGMSYAFSRTFQAYGFLQLPLYQDVKGVQLVADYAVTVGFSVRF